MTLTPGSKYFLASKAKIVEFSGFGQTGKAIVHPPGEPDMQSSYAVDPDHLTALSSQGCPQCGGLCPAGSDLCVTCQNMKNFEP